jgi:hypothetical protein
MKVVLSLMTILGLSGCIAIGPSGPTGLASGSDGAMWSVRPTADVAACLAAKTQESDTVTYRADPVDNDKVIYRTRVSIFGVRDSHSHEAAVSCL